MYLAFVLFMNSLLYSGFSSHNCADFSFCNPYTLGMKEKKPHKLYTVYPSDTNKIWNSWSIRLPVWNVSYKHCSHDLARTCMCKHNQKHATWFTNGFVELYRCASYDTTAKCPLFWCTICTNAVFMSRPGAALQQLMGPRARPLTQIWSQASNHAEISGGRISLHYTKHRHKDHKKQGPN